MPNRDRESSNPPRYAIIGGTLWGNRGAEAMTVTAIAQMRARVPKARFLLLSYYPKQDQTLNRDPDVTVASATPGQVLLGHFPAALAFWLCAKIGIRLPLPAKARALRDCAGLLDVSGISFHDGRLAVLVYNVFCIWPALLLGVSVIHLSQARGPFEHPLNRALSKRFLSACRHVFARGDQTAAHMRDLGLPEARWSIAPDVAFAFEDGDSITAEGDEKTQEIVARMVAAREAGRSVIVISPSSVVAKKTREAGIAYLDILAATIDRLTREGVDVVLMPNATRARAEGERNNDIVVIKRLVQALETRLSAQERTRLGVVDFDLNTDRIRDIVREADLVVTSRFHAMVAALSLAVPTLVIGWSHKYLEVLSMFGCENDAIDYSRLDTGLYPAIQEAMAQRDPTHARIASRLPEIKAAARAQFDMVARVP